MVNEIKDEEIKENMEEVCQPIVEPPKFYKKGKNWHCLCNKQAFTCSSPECKIQGVRLGIKVGRGICEHNKIRSICKKCGGGSMCEHNKRRFVCKECGGNGICEHNKVRSICKACGGSDICEHGRARSHCKECGGGSICEHNKLRSRCKECGGGSICEHNRDRFHCKECGGNGICEHNKRHSSCKECNGGAICEHNKLRSICKECGGSQICEHNRHRFHCKECSSQNYLANLRRSRRRTAIKTSNPTHTLDDLCMTIKEWSDSLHKTFEDRYGRPKTDEDEVHIDEIIPCSAWDLPNDNKYCWHYLNSQWLMAKDNLSKGDSYEEYEKFDMIERIQNSSS